MEGGKIKVDFSLLATPRVILDNYEEQFNDGKWHIVVLAMSQNSMTLSVNYRPMKTVKQFKMTTGADYLIAGNFR